MLLTAWTGTASAVEFDFYKLGRGNSKDFEATDGIAATGGDLASSDVKKGIFNGNLTFVSGGITAVATGSYLGNAAAVVQDRESGWTDTIGAGLGVYHVAPLDTSDDNVTKGEVLTITFDQVVKLTSIGLRADGHNITGWSTGDKFLFNGVQTILPDDVGSISVNQIGKVFTFAFDPTQGPSAQFYLAAMTVATAPDSGGTFSMFGSALFSMAALRRRLRFAR